MWVESCSSVERVLWVLPLAPDGYVEVDRVQVVAADAFAAQSGAGVAGGPVVDGVVVG
jgi:hypothetical protein